MTEDLINLLILSLLFLLLFGIAEVLYHVFHFQAEHTRKIVHVGTGLLTMLFPVMLSNHWYVLLICSSFLLLLVVSLRFDFLKSINAVGRFTLGSVMYPVAVYLSFLSYSFHPSVLHHQTYIWFYLPVLIMATADPAAALAGRRWPLGKYKIGNETRTLLGSVVFVVVALAVSSLLMALLVPYAVFTVSMMAGLLLLSLTTAVSEAISKKGLDNLMIPLTAIVMMQVCKSMMGLV